MKSYEKYWLNHGPNSPPKAEIFCEKPLGVLVRSVVGLSRKAAKEAFAEFLSKAPLDPDQIAFLNELIEFLVQNGTMEPNVLF